MNEQLNVWEHGLGVVRKLDKKSSAKSFRLTVMRHEEYCKKAETDANVKTNILQHKALIGAWTKNIAKSIKQNPKSQRALIRLVLQAHGKTPYFNYQELGKYEVPPKVANNFVKEIGDKGHALEILNDFKFFSRKTIYNEADAAYISHVTKKERMDHPTHLAYHAAIVYFEILGKAIHQLEEKS